MVNKISKEQVRKKLIKAANLYDKNLCNYNLLFVYGNPLDYTNKEPLNKFETIFYDYNFFHLTGLDYNNSWSGNNYYKNIYFYNLCLNNEISLPDIIINDNSVFEKLSIIDSAFNLNSPISYGKFTYFGKSLKAESVVGNKIYSFCFVRDNCSKFFVPNSLLAESIDKTSSNRKKLYAIFRKPVSQDLYDECIYYSKNFDIYYAMDNTNAFLNFIELLDIKNMKIIRL